jgi:type II secretory ATPase GspE/PulE/Tfp pilus assembly ATPase PilB-like protein
MTNPQPASLPVQLLSLDCTADDYATRFVDRLLCAARECTASDVHVLPTPAGLEISWRIDGVLQTLGVFPPGSTSSVVARLKVLADLLTYRTDVPQEGRIRAEPGVEMRVSTLPTLYGEKAVVRLFQSGERFLRLADLGLPSDVHDELSRLLSATSGAILVTGPAGSGKTTTLYACLRELTSRSSAGRSIVTLEDPIEIAVSGVTQSQASAAAGYDMAAGLRAIVRQDPEVIMVGEIRDRATAVVALQASLTGQLVLSSFHAGSSASAVSRLLDMGIEPYVLRSGILAIVSQRLVRRLCDCSRGSAQGTSDCPFCGGTGYHGRLLLAELLRPTSAELHQAILGRSDAESLARLAKEAGMIDLVSQAQAAVEAGLTTQGEVRRVLG